MKEVLNKVLDLYYVFRKKYLSWRTQYNLKLL